MNIAEFNPGLIGTMDPLLERRGLRCGKYWVWAVEPFTPEKMDRLKQSLKEQIAGGVAPGEGVSSVEEPIRDRRMELYHEIIKRKFGLDVAPLCSEEGE